MYHYYLQLALIRYWEKASRCDCYRDLFSAFYFFFLVFSLYQINHKADSYDEVTRVLSYYEYNVGALLLLFPPEATKTANFFDYYNDLQSKLEALLTNEVCHQRTDT